MKPISECHLYAIIDSSYVAMGQISTMTRSLLRGGVDLIQLRAKTASREELLEMAGEIAPLCRAAQVPFILNDHPELAAEARADGAHVGQEDLSVAEARKMAGSGAIIGKSTHSMEQARAAASESPDYIGFGPLFATPTKPDYTPIGTDLIEQVHAIVSLPVFCIGGIKLSNLPEVLHAGARRVVIVSDLLLAADPEQQSASCKALLQY
jgi:thiamine-phosphate pyrophosphorylase